MIRSFVETKYACARRGVRTKQACFNVCVCTRGTFILQVSFYFISWMCHQDVLLVFGANAYCFFSARFLDAYEHLSFPLEVYTTQKRLTHPFFVT